MPKPAGCVGQTKLKLLAVLHYHEVKGIDSYGYNLWMTLKERFHLYLDDTDSRNVYHHLQDLTELGLVQNKEIQEGDKAPNRRIITLTPRGHTFEERYDKYLEILLRDDA